jgi:hypothetical protein
MNIDPDLLNDDLSSTMGTETLLAYGMVPASLPLARGLLSSRYAILEERDMR